MYHPLAVRPSQDSDTRPLDPTSTGRLRGPSASSPMSSYPMAERPSTLQKHSQAATTGHDVERGHPGPYIRIADGAHLNINKTNNSTPTGAGHSRDSSFLHEATHFDYRKQGPEQYRVAQGDIPDNKVTRFYHYLVGVSMITRWALFIVPVLGCLWIPGILGLTAFPNGHIWWTPLIWWSIWFSVWWGGYWASLAFSMILPKILRYTIGVIAMGTRKYIDWMAAIHRYVAIFTWALVSFVSFIPLIKANHKSDRPQDAADAVDICSRVLLGILICSAILLGLKILIQAIASNFHERSYAERLETQRRNTRTLVALYINSTDHPERADTLHDGPQGGANKADPTRFLKNFLRGAKGVAQSTTQAFGNIATEIVGSSVLQPNSPQAIVAQALTSPNKTRLLARRLYYSFRKTGAEVIRIADIEEYFNGHDAAVDAFAMFDRDGNGDATREEMELACMDLHREKLALASSMRDIDSAVGRLDNILMTIYVAVAGIVFAVTLDAAVSTLLTGAAGFLLALSWLIGASMQEILASIIFLFVKVMYDVGDRVEIDGNTYTIKEIRLLSTIFIDARGCQVQAPNVVLNSKFIYNHRRSQQMSEPYTYDVAWDVTFEQLEALRARMLAFVKEERRDYLPVFDVVVDNFTDQSKLSLKSDIKYKSNWQQGALKVQRRNKWICALKSALKEAKIFGPSGDPGAVADPVEYTQVPWDEVRRKKEKAANSGTDIREPLIPRSNYQLLDKNQTVLDQSQDVFGENRDMAMTAPKQTVGMRQRAGLGYSGGVASSGPTGGRPTAEGAFQGPGPMQTAGAAAAGAAAATIIVSQAEDDNDGDGN